MKRVLFDTDVILDLLFDRKPYSDDTALLLSLCETNKILGYVTPVILSNIYYLLRQTSTHQHVVTKLSQLLEILDILKMDKSSIKLALSSPFKDFEDALQNYAAEQSQKIDVILTRNFKDYAHSKLSVMTPKQYIKAHCYTLHPNY